MTFIVRARLASIAMLARAASLGAQDLAQLPQDSVPIPPAEAPCTRTVTPEGNLQQALRRARAGQVICLTPGGTYQSIVLTQRDDSGWVILRTAAPDSAFAQPGERVRPSAAKALARIVQTNDKAAISTQPAAAGWRLIGLDVTTSVLSYAIVALGLASAPQRTIESIPYDIILDRVYIHGTPDQTVRRCVALNSARTAIVNSWLDDCHEKGADSQAIGGWNGPGPYRIENNTLAGAGENVMFGGADAAVPGLIPSDIVIARNYVVTPLSWKGRWSKKNILELKSAARVLIEANVFEGSWQDGQTGYAIVFKSTNQSGKCPWCNTKDVTFQRNWVRNAGAGMNIAGREGGHPYDVDSVTRRLMIRENLIEDLNVKGYIGEGRLLQLVTGVRQVTLDRNVIVTTGAVSRAISLQRDQSALQLVMRNNVLSHGQYGLLADDRGVGAPSLGALPGAQMSGNVFVVGRNGGQGGGNTPGFSFATSLNYSAVNRSTRQAVRDATRGVIVDP